MGIEIYLKVCLVTSEVEKKKKDTAVKKAINPHERLKALLRFLATSRGRIFVTVSFFASGSTSLHLLVDAISTAFGFLYCCSLLI